MKSDQDARQARAEMEAARAQSEAKSSKNVGPRRYRIYDKIKDHVSLRTIDIIIAVTALAIIALLVYGIITANPQ